MPDHATHELPRIALVYGQEAAVAHVRDAVGEQLDVVYAAPAGEFDVARMQDARVAAALVNLDDGGDWLDAVEARLEQAGIAVVYNDPEISRGLEGWERARWLRHLVAKLRGSSDVDPPRPEPGLPPAPETHPAVAAAPAVETAPETPEIATPAGDATLAELPLSPEEIETMTVDLAAEQEPAAAAANDAPADVMAMDLAVEEAAASATRAEALEAANADPGAPALPTAPPDTDFDSGGLDVDTEALSAMIDARLAESEAETPSDSPQVWRVASGGAVSPVQMEAVAEAATTNPTPDATTPAVEPAPAVPDDADVLASLPALDDWALVDHEAPATATEKHVDKTPPEPTFSDNFAGLELVPMETIAPVHISTDPIERWLDDSKPAKPDAETTNARAGGGKA